MATSAGERRAFMKDDLAVEIFPDAVQMGAQAAEDLAGIIAESVARRGEASIIVATGNSQLRFMEAIRQRSDVPWDKVYVFHMDEYLGMSDEHPASFRLYIRQRLTDIVRPRAFFGVDGDAADIDAELARYTALLAEHPADACVLGIGENGHLAFNDPPADFWTPKTIHVVDLVESCRQQQVGEGHFRTIDDVPKQALSLTVPALLRPPRVLAVVPEARKAAAVQATLEGPITRYCPATALRTKPGAKLYLDRESASLIAS